MVSIDSLIEQLRTMSQKQRQDLLSAFKKDFCIECGKADPNCPCWLED